MATLRITTWAQTAIFRRLICVLVIPLTLLSGMSFDLHVTHEQGSSSEHTHVSRVLGAVVGDDHRHHHQDHDHDRDHGHPPSPSPCEPPAEPCCCGGIPESTTVVRGASHLNRPGRDFAKQLDDQMGVVVFAGGTPLRLTEIAVGAGDAASSLAPLPRHGLRTTVLLI